MRFKLIVKDMQCIRYEAYGESITGVKDMYQDPGIIINLPNSKNRKEILQKHQEENLERWF